MIPRHSNALMALFSGVLALTLIYIFYASPLRDRVENKFFDIRTRLAPNFLPLDQVAIVSIDDNAINNLSRLHPTYVTAKGSSKDLSFAGLERVIRETMATKAKVIAVLLPPQIFPYTSPDLKKIVALAASDQRIVLGTFDLTSETSGIEGLPESLRPVSKQLAKADVVREFRREIVRDLRVSQAGELPFLAFTLASRLASENTEALAKQARDAQNGVVSIKLNYIAKDSLPTVPADSLLNAPTEFANLFAQRAALIGYTSFRPWTRLAHEATLVNSPWEVDGQDMHNGLPLVSLQATAVENLADGSFLAPSPTSMNVLQTVLITTLTLLIWRLEIGFASFLFIGGWSLVLLMHASLFAFNHRYLPLADAALMSTLAMITGALYRLRAEGRLRASYEAKMLAEAELAQVQDRFLNRFASELASINRKVKGALDPHHELRSMDGTVGTAYVRALVSSEELDDYLQGIHEFAAIPNSELKKPKLVAIDLGEVTAKVIRQFEARCREQKIHVETVFDTPPSDCLAMADGMLVSQILYNLVSNAIKYSPPGGTVMIRLGSYPQNTVIRVSDKGPGIPKEFQSQIFEKFYRVKDDYVYKLKGHGLGLYLSRYFATKIDASLAVDSVPGEGAEFSLTLRPARRLK